jgi:hypothetical protein
VRTTVTLDEDVAAKLQAEARKSGRTFKEVVNEVLRRGFSARPTRGSRPPFRVSARDLGASRGNLDDVSALLEQVEGSLHR